MLPLAASPRFLSGADRRVQKGHFPINCGLHDPVLRLSEALLHLPCGPGHPELFNQVLLEVCSAGLHSLLKGFLPPSFLGTKAGEQVALTALALGGRGRPHSGGRPVRGSQNSLVWKKRGHILI